MTKSIKLKDVELEEPIMVEEDTNKIIKREPTFDTTAVQQEPNLNDAVYYNSPTPDVPQVENKIIVKQVDTSMESPELHRARLNEIINKDVAKRKAQGSL